MIKNKFFNALTIALILFQAVLPINALAMTSTDLQDYGPGSVVTISGDNSDGAGFQAGETVHVDVMDPDGAAVLACDAVADENGAWSCQVTLAADAAGGAYSYSAVGETSGAAQSGGFTVTVPTPPTPEPTQPPTAEPTAEPTLEPTAEPTQPTVEPTSQPTQEPTAQPTQEPTSAPTSEPTVAPTPTAVVYPSAPFITSDKDDYAPGELVTLTS